MTIRPAAVEDGPAVIAMALRFLRETPYGRLAEGATAERLGAVFEYLREGSVVLVAEEGGRLKGFLALFAAPHPWTGELYGDEAAWWVEPEARGGGIGTRLFAEFEAWARARQIWLLKVAAPWGDEAVGRFYERMGYEPVETVYQKRLSAVPARVA